MYAPNSESLVYLLLVGVLYYSNREAIGCDRIFFSIVLPSLTLPFNVFFDLDFLFECRRVTQLRVMAAAISLAAVALGLKQQPDILAHFMEPQLAPLSVVAVLGSAALPVMTAVQWRQGRWHSDGDTSAVVPVAPGETGQQE